MNASSTLTANSDDPMGYTYISPDRAAKFTQQPTLDDVVQYAEKVRALEVSLNNTYRSSITSVRHAVVRDIQIIKISRELNEANNDKAAALFLHSLTQQEFASWQYNNNVIVPTEQQTIPYRAGPKIGNAPVRTTRGVTVASEPVNQDDLISDDDLFKALEEVID